MRELDPYKQHIIDFYGARTNYDNDYTYRRAIPLVELAQLQQGQRVLDIATGTGIVAIAAAQIVGSDGQVTGVDICPGMLEQARRKIEAANLQIELIEADADYLEFEEESFDAILCTSAIALLKDIPATLRNWYGWLKPGGLMGFTCYSEASHFTPLIAKVSAKQGISLPNLHEPLGSPQKCRQLLQQTGFQDVKVKIEQFGSYLSLSDAKERWNGDWLHPNNPFTQLSQEQMGQLKAEYREAVARLSTERGVWYDITTFFVTGRK